MNKNPIIPNPALGGRATKKKYGSDFYKKIAKRRWKLEKKKKLSEVFEGSLEKTFRDATK